MYGGGDFFVQVAKVGRGGRVQRNASRVFGDDIGIGGRHMEMADWKIMGNGGI